MIRYKGSSWMVLLVAMLGVAACSGDAAEPAAEAVAQTPADMEAENPCAANPCAANPCAAGQELPEGVTMAMVEEGEGLYAGAGICMTCHAPDGSGVPNLGADLTDDEWTHSDGSYDGIVKTVMEGVTADASSSGVPMPAKGGTAITDDQAKAVSAYVWTLSK
ncbi:MAG: c-type cytochrome [Gemmatimonadota bacterium]